MTLRIAVSLNGLLVGLALVLSLQGCKDKRNVKILILGNSITQNGPVESIGWYGNWGMAASAAEKDYVHVFRSKLNVLDVNISLEAKNIAYWESDFSSDLSGEKILEFHPDILIIRLGENVPENAANYDAAIVKLVDKIQAKKVIITGSFWPSVKKDSIQAKVAGENGYEFVGLSDLWWDDTNQAIGKFENGGVAAHPSDLGMERIATKLFDKASILIDSSYSK